MKTIGVIGAGQMGAGIAHVCALAGLDVLLHDVSDKAVESGLATISGNMARQVGSERITEDERHAALKRLKAADGLDSLSAADFVIEAATEREDVKQAIYKELCPHLAPNAILATNTSSISITRLAAATDRPEKFLGVHFMNPGAGDATCRTGARHRDRRRDVQRGQKSLRSARQGNLGFRRLPRLHRQPHPDPDDQ